MNKIDVIKDRISMLEVLEMYSIYPKRGRNNYLCFVHEDKHPSAGITKDGKTFHCFSCGCSLSVLDVVQHFENCDLKMAMQILDEKFKLGLCKPLTLEEYREQELKEIQREKEKRKKRAFEKLCKEYSKLVVRQIRFWEKVVKDTHITRGEYRKGSWELEDLYFYATQELSRLNWFYDVVNDVSGWEENSFALEYGIDRKQIVSALVNGDIQI